MAEMVFSAVLQEFVSQGISFVLGKRKMNDSQGHMIERLEMAASGLELALERSAKMPITDVSLLKRRRMLKCAYLEAMELLDKHKQQPAKQIVQGVKRTRWISNNVPTNSFASLSTDDIRRFEWFADCADKFLRDVEYGCSLRQYTFCSPSIRQLLEGKTLLYRLEQGNHLRCFYVWPVCTEDRGVEAVLGYRSEDRTNTEKCFFLLLVLRLSESMDIVQVATKGLQFLTSQFQIAAESALGELTLLPTLLQEVHHSYNVPCLGIQQWHTEQAQQCRPDPACCKTTGRHGLCGDNALPHIFFEQLIYLGFQCYVSEPEPTSSSDSGEVGKSISRSGWMPPMSVSTVAFTPHSVHEALQDSSYPVKTIGNAEEPRDGSMLKVAKTIKSDSIKCEAVSKGISFVMGKREEKASQGHIKERLEMAINDLELALERSANLPITDVSLLQRRKMINCAYVEATELLNKHKEQSVQDQQEEAAHGVKRKRSWLNRAKDLFISSYSGLNMDDVRRFEWFADCAGKFVRDVESGCSLWHYTFCNPIVRHLLQGKTLKYGLDQGNQPRSFYIWPTHSEERGVEAVLGYHYEDTTMVEKCFFLLLVVRLSECIDIVQIATKGLQLLKTQFKIAAESAMGELTLLPNLQDIAHSYETPQVGILEQYTKLTRLCRPDPACCRESRHKLYGNNILSELPHIFPEQVLFWGFYCYMSALEPSSSNEVAGGRINRGWTSPLGVTFGFTPHSVYEVPQGSYAVETIGNVIEHRDTSIQQMLETIKSDAINCLLGQPKLTEYRLDWYSRHGAAGFHVQKPIIERTRRRHNIQGSTKRSTRTYLGCPCPAIRLQQATEAFHGGKCEGKVWNAPALSPSLSPYSTDMWDPMSDSSSTSLSPSPLLSTTRARSLTRITADRAHGRSPRPLAAGELGPRSRISLPLLERIGVRVCTSAADRAR
ncbi:hypothetical protein U9M48_011542 [Paspalum notatum var. saurae]|uniref:Uncharacterized protein n=1 Tax=Paspalum notatum var. saurae TaxID=547442 RepID=A0AAQ3SXA2_PASNO